MVLPIVAYGDIILRKKGININSNYPNLTELIENMKETMRNAQGVGLAAPQIGKDIRLFIIDTSPFAEDEELSEEEKEYLSTLKKVFINAKIIKEEGEEWAFKEGCLSIPNIRENVLRKEQVTIEYEDENFKKHTQIFNGLAARVIQHEYDHIEGILFTDKVSSLKKRLLKRKLEKIARGEVVTDYKMRFPLQKKK